MDVLRSGLTNSCHEEHMMLFLDVSGDFRCSGVSSTLKEQLKGHYNMSQQAAIAAAVSPGQATFSLLQVCAALGSLAPATKG